MSGVSVFCVSIDLKLKNRSRGTLTFISFILLKHPVKRAENINPWNKYEMLKGALRPAFSAHQLVLTVLILDETLEANKSAEASSAKSH